MKIFTIALALIPMLAWGSGITNGDYELTFVPETKGKDKVIGQQSITITNIWWTHNLSAMYFDVVIETNGSLKRFEGDRQIVRGLVYEGRFKFVIPYANVVDVTPYIFEGSNNSTNADLDGTGTVEWPLRAGGPTPLRFWMKKIQSPNKALQAIGDKSPQPER